MKHRHLNHEEFSPAAIDDIITRGKMVDWVGLRNAAKTNPEVVADILQVCAPWVENPYNQRYIFWRTYAKKITRS